MRRRKAVKAIALSTVVPQVLFNTTLGNAQTASSSDVPPASFVSDWENWPDMLWTGPKFWGNRLQDWQIREGKAVCVVSGKDRTLHSLCCELRGNEATFETTVTLEFVRKDDTSAEGHAGFVIGARGRFDDYRSAAVFGEGLRAGIKSDGRLFVGELTGEKNISLDGPVILHLQATSAGGKYQISLRATRAKTTLDERVLSDVSSQDLRGNIALLSHFDGSDDKTENPSVAFGQWSINGPKVSYDEAREFGPICFAQYTIHKKVLKLTAQLAPIEKISGQKISLQIRNGDQWLSIAQSKIDSLGRSAHFRVDDWEPVRETAYRVRVVLPLKDGDREYFYDGRIALEPFDASQVKMAVFSCNCDHGFPDADIPLHVNKHKADLAVFLGDQFYESTGGFGIQTSPFEKSCLDYLRKWYMFGWSYREIFRDIPSACIPDDHDVYHGNVWGEGGKVAPTNDGWGYPAQDRGGYKMPAEWVNMVQRTQTSHLPDPYDPTPVEQGIGVYYTTWNYAGVSMAILEDRKFKSAPKITLPEAARVTNGFIQNPDFEIKKHYNIDAQLLGERQLKFLQDWVSDWGGGTEMKAVLSQTNFCAVATLPKGSIIDSIVPQLPVPKPGEYVTGDAPTTDMDSNGWPPKGRDEALKIIRKAFALHIAGDQHLASVVKYGVDEFGDAGFAFAGPALNNLWPRRWWPPVESNHISLEGKPRYTGDFEDGFGNKMTVHAVANPQQSGREPAIIYNRATGYGIVTFDKQNRTMTVECWPRFADPDEGIGGQYSGWPIRLKQEGNYGRKERGFLPLLNIHGLINPVVQIIHEGTGEIEYTIRIKGGRFRPRIFTESTYTIRVFDPDKGKEKTITGIGVAVSDNDRIEVYM